MSNKKYILILLLNQILKIILNTPLYIYPIGIYYDDSYCSVYHKGSHFYIQLDYNSYSIESSTNSFYLNSTIFSESMVIPTKCHLEKGYGRFIECVTLKDVPSYIKGNLHVNSTTNFIIFETKENEEVIISNFVLTNEITNNYSPNAISFFKGIFKEIYIVNKNEDDFIDNFEIIFQKYNENNEYIPQIFTKTENGENNIVLCKKINNNNNLMINLNCDINYNTFPYNDNNIKTYNIFFKNACKNIEKTNIIINIIYYKELKEKINLYAKKIIFPNKCSNLYDSYFYIQTESNNQKAIKSSITNIQLIDENNNEINTKCSIPNQINPIITCKIIYDVDINIAGSIKLKNIDSQNIEIIPYFGNNNNILYNLKKINNYTNNYNKNYINIFNHNKKIYYINKTLKQNASFQYFFEEKINYKIKTIAIKNFYIDLIDKFNINNYKYNILENCEIINNKVNCKIKYYELEEDKKNSSIDTDYYIYYEDACENFLPLNITIKVNIGKFLNFNLFIKLLYLLII